MSLLLLTDGAFQALDDVGQPLPNARLRFLRAYTTAPQAVYDASDLEDELSDAQGDVTADSQGQFPDIYMDTTWPYRVQLFDQFGRLRWDIPEYACSCGDPSFLLFRSPIPTGDVGATLDFYVTETETRTNTYADPGRMAPHPNPLTANAAGRFPPVYLDDDVSYKVVRSGPALEEDPYSCFCTVYEGNSVPTITSLDPDEAEEDSGSFTLTVNGTNFVDGVSVVRWDGSDRTTTFVSTTQLTAIILAADIEDAGEVDVTVFNGAPGGGESNAETFTVTAVTQRLLDLFPGAALAYSVRLLDSDYMGACLRVRRSSDNMEMDIGFASGELDTDALLSFVGAGDGLVTRWYDQSGNTDHAFAPSDGAQPRIVASGVVVTDGDQPAIEPVDAGDRFNTPVPAVNIKTMFIVANTVQPSYQVSNSNRLITNYPGTGSVENNLVFDVTSGILRLLDGGVSVSDGGDYTRGRHLHYGLRDATPELTIGYDGGNTVSDGSPGDSDISAYRLIEDSSSGNTDEQPTKIQEVVVYHSDQSSNRAGIDSNINAYYGIYV